MFGNSKKNEVPSTATKSNGSNALNSLVVGTHVEGNITSQNDIRIDGSIKGELNCKSKVIIGVKGKVEGTVICQNAVVEGSFTGKLTVKESLIVRETGRVEGDVNAGKLTVESGGVFNVQCNMSSAPAKKPNQKANA